MADVSSSLKDWSTTASSNSPTDSTTIGAGLADNFQQIQATVRQALAHKGSDITSAATIDIGAVEGSYHDVTGSTGPITSFGTVSAGITKVLQFDSTPTLTHNGTSLILPGDADITAEAGDHLFAVSLGSGNWVVPWFVRAALPPTRPVLGTEQATTSGTEKDFTIPAWAKKIIVQFFGVSTNGSSDLIIQLGDGGGIEPTGYLGSVSTLTNAVVTANRTAGFGLTAGISSASILHGTAVISLEDAAAFTWVCSSSLGHSDAATMQIGSGSKSLSAALTTVRITMSNGTDAFDAGAINVLYE